MPSTPVITRGSLPFKRVSQILISFRCSAACAYYTPFTSRPNLQVFLNATVTRIIWSNTSLVKGLADSIEYVRDGAIFQIPIEKELILAAGTIGSPKILELSGIGNETYGFFNTLYRCMTDVLTG